MHRYDLVSPSARAISAILASATVALVGWYLYAWRSMPLYSDEVALRLQSARALVDGSIRYPAFPQCSASPVPIPWSLAPGAYLVSAWDFAADWSFIRLVPAIALLAAIGASLVLMLRKGPNPAVLLMTSGFVGVAGSGLILMRMECFLVFQAASCMFAYLCATTRQTALINVMALTAVALASLTSVYVHSQGLILMPVTVLASVSIFANADSVVTKLAAVLVVGLLLCGSYAAFGGIQFRCDAVPEIVTALQERTIAGKGQLYSFLNSFVPWQDKIDNYVRNFTFNSSYTDNYIPGIPQKFANGFTVNYLNYAVYFIITLNLLTAIGVTIASLISSAKFLLKHVRQGETKALLKYGAPYLALAGMTHIAYMIYDTQGAFYRAHYFNFIYCLIAALGLSSISRRYRLLVLPFAIISVSTLLLSSNFNRHFFEVQFGQGWSGPSLPLDTDWAAISNSVNHLVRSCGIADGDPAIIVDDLTFAALKRHPHLIPITYAAYGYSIIHKNLDSGFGESLPKIASAAVVRCSLFGTRVPDLAVQQGIMCCTKFK